MGLAGSKGLHHSEIGSLHPNGRRDPPFCHQSNGRMVSCKHHRRLSAGSGVLKNVLVGKPRSWGTEPRIVLANKSSFRVSYWVAQEDKNKTPDNSARHQRQVVTSINQHLNVLGGQTTSAASGLQRDPMETTTTATTGESPSSPPADLDEDAVYFLTRDHRMGPMGNTQATKVAFPVDCQDMRVYAFFEVDGRWRLYEDKVYSIGLFKKVFTLTSINSNITPHIGQAGSETTAPSTAVPVRDGGGVVLICTYLSLVLNSRKKL